MKESNNKSKKTANRFLAIAFAIVLAGFFTLNIISNNRVDSDRENRILTQRPALTLQGISDGSYTEEFETYESDQFVMRSLFREINVMFRRIGGSREENGVILGRRRQLMEDIVVPTTTILNGNSEGINDYASRHSAVKTHILLVPDAAEILGRQLPPLATVEDQSRLFRVFQAQLKDNIIWMDGISAMENHTDQKLYYQTDSHWTTEGAYQVFLETASDLGISSPEVVSYDVYCAAADFRGDLSRTSGFMPGQREEVDVWIPVDKTSYLVTYSEESEKVPSLYDVDALDTWNKYSVFLDDNYPLVDIETASESDRVLLIVKDSFADCFIPFLIPYYARIVAVDPTSYSGGIDELTDAYGVTDTLFLYDGNNFFSDTSLMGFLNANE